jgi:small subunit ribosomal protein YMR-31
MRPTLLRLAQHRTPLIKFLGKRSLPKPDTIDHTPQLHPADPHPSLPDSFAESFVHYRDRAIQHGPLVKGQSSSSSSSTSSQGSGSGSASGPKPTSGPSAYGLIGGRSGKSLGPVAAGKGEFFDRSELPRRFQPVEWEQKEIDAVESGGASLWN